MREYGWIVYCRILILVLNVSLFIGSPKTKEPSRGGAAYGFAKPHSFGGWWGLAPSCISGWLLAVRQVAIEGTSLCHDCAIVLRGRPPWEEIPQKLIWIYGNDNLRFWLKFWPNLWGLGNEEKPYFNFRGSPMVVRGIFDHISCAYHKHGAFRPASECLLEPASESDSFSKLLLAHRPMRQWWSIGQDAKC